MSFSHALQFGAAGASDIATWLRDLDWSLLPAYEKIFDTGKGPVILLPSGVRIAPDYLTWKGQKCRWVEAKRKSAFTWHKITWQWTTGIDLRHYNEYLKVEDDGPWPVWLLFLHDGGEAKNSPSESPSGLFGNSLDYLRKHENHRSDKWGPSGMVYWAIDSLILLSELPLKKPVARVTESGIIVPNPHQSIATGHPWPPSISQKRTRPSRDNGTLLFDFGD